MKKIFLFTALAVLFATQPLSRAAVQGRSLQFSSPEQLQPVSGTAIYSIVQDSRGAIWLNTGFGLYRFNGNEGTFKTKPLPMHQLCASPDGNEIFAISSDSLYGFSVTRSEPDIYRSCGRDLTNCALLWHDGRPVIGIGKELCIRDADSLKTLTTCDIQGSFVAGIRTSDGGVLLSTDKLELLKLTPDMKVSSLTRTESAISVFFRGGGGKLWAGTRSRGLALADEETLALDYTDGYPGFTGSRISEVRTIAEGTEGQLYFGTANGLYCQETKEGGKSATHRVELNGNSSVPVCSVFRSKNNSLWVGTFYDGVYYSCSESIPFRSITSTDGVDARLIKTIVPMSDGRKAMLFTDGNGVFLLDLSSNKTELIGSLPLLKYQSACDRGEKIIAVDYTPEILIISKEDFSYQRIDVNKLSATTFPDKFNCISYFRNELYAGGNKGLYLIDLEGKRIFKTGSINERILNLKASGKETLLAAGEGLYEWNGRETVTLRKGEDFTDATYGEDGTLWAATSGLGLLKIRPDGNTRFYNRSTDGLGSDFLSTVVCIGEGRLALGSRAGISLLDCNSGIVRNYSSSNGLSLGSNLARTTAALGEKVIFGGTTGPAVLDKSAIDNPETIPLVEFEKMTVNGEELLLSEPLYCQKSITLQSGQKNFNVTVATFDYPEITAGVFSYRLEGFETEWNPLNIYEQIIYRNLDPGKYRLCIRSMAGDRILEKSLQIKIKPEWWQNWWVITLLIILFFMILALILRTTYTKILLAEKLRNREKENEERTKYFVSISRSLRNPLSLIIGQLEILLRSDIAKSGINQIESIYKNAEQMQRVISDYETLENQAVEAEAATYVQPSRISITEARFHEYRMLIADENDEIREMLRTIFSSQYDIIEVKDGKEAWSIASREIPDIIISDVKLPGLSGTELCQRLRQNFETSHIVIILLTAHASEQASLIGMKSGADDYITKPFNVKMLEARCGNFLKSRKMLMNKYSLSGVNRRKESFFTPEAKFLNAAIGAVERNISNPDFSVGKLCEELCTSKTGLTNKLHEAVGMSPRDFIEDLRLKKAAQSLLDGGKSIAEIADEFCFCSAKYFSVRFRKKFGVIPSRYSTSVQSDSTKQSNGIPRNEGR